MTPTPKAAMILLGAVAAGCQYDPFAHRYVTTEPQAIEVAGTYVMTSQTMLSPAPAALHLGSNRDAPRIRLDPGGRYEATGFPTWAEASLQWKLTGSVDGGGEWKIRWAGSVSNGWTDKPYYGVDFETPVADTAAIARNGGKLQLIFVHGDPDTGDAMVFERVEGDSAG